MEERAMRYSRRRRGGVFDGMPELLAGAVFTVLLPLTGAALLMWGPVGQRAPAPCRGRLPGPGGGGGGRDALEPAAGEQRKPHPGRPGGGAGGGPRRRDGGPARLSAPDGAAGGGERGELGPAAPGGLRLPDVGKTAAPLRREDGQVPGPGVFRGGSQGGGGAVGGGPRLQRAPGGAGRGHQRGHLRRLFLAPGEQLEVRLHLPLSGG